MSELRNITPEELKKVLAEHKLWLEGSSNGKGLRHASICFTGFGECDRKLTVVGLPEGLTYFCGCFKGSETDLREYIDRGEDDLRESRLAGLECLKAVLKFSEPST